MSENKQDSSVEADLNIHIVRMNTDKTRKDTGSDTVYHVYFELSTDPPSEWKTFFGQEWTKLNVKGVAEIDQAFLVLHCQLNEVPASLLQALKMAVAATNAAYAQNVEKVAVDHKHRQDVWKQERTDVDKMASLLRFD
ncbi:MAG: hypothetical protein H6Q30_1712 [Bacteroidetes bacterium]|jgi:hypothetical protein|nr:hypothetical protein [Bacteroidota bacterium]